MVSRATTVCCLIIGAICIGSGVAGAIHPLPLAKAVIAAPSTPITDFDAEQNRLQQLADNSCRCERRAGAKGKKACWAAFDAQLPENELNEQFTTCLPIPRTLRCKQSDAPANNDIMIAASGPCATTEYRYEGGDGDVFLCSKEEATAVERIWNREVDANPRSNAGTPMADKLARNLAAGKPIPVTSGRGGCTSS